MKRFVLPLMLLIGVIGVAVAQPTNPEPGKCYVRCVKPDVFDTKTVTITTRPAYKKLEVVPAEYKTVEETVQVKPATKKFVYVPAQFETYTEEMKVEDEYKAVSIVPASFGDDSEVIEVEPAVSRMEYQKSYANCESVDPRDCQVLCYVEYPAQSKAISKKVLAKDAGYTSSPKGGKTIKVQKQRIVKEASVQEINIDAEYKTITKKILVKDETVKEIAVPAETATQSVRVLKEKGSVNNWEEVDCGLTSFNVLPIFYELGSARLTADSRKILDEKLVSLMKAKTGIRVEITSHTDSRGSASSNMTLSQARANSVVDYLASRGIKRSRLESKGYGETQLKNNCGDDSTCTEDQHQVNRRTEFRVLSN